MGFFQRKKTATIACGDRFVKIGCLDSGIWEVVDIWAAVNNILHARLCSHEEKSTSTTVALDVLADPAYWLPSGLEA